MLSDSDEAIRKMAVNKILDARKSHDPNQVRIRVLPSLIVDAKNYHEVIDWDKELITEPRPTIKISKSDLLEIGEGTKKLENFISKIICHSTRNEFAVADTAKKVRIRNTHKKATIAILQGLKSRKKYNYRHKKRDFISF